MVRANILICKLDRIAVKDSSVNENSLGPIYSTLARSKSKTGKNRPKKDTLNVALKSLFLSVLVQYYRVYCTYYKFTQSS